MPVAGWKRRHALGVQWNEGGIAVYQYGFNASYPNLSVESVSLSTQRPTCSYVSRVSKHFIGYLIFSFISSRTGLANIVTVPIFLVHLLLVTLFMNPDQSLLYIRYVLEGLQTINVTLLHFYTDQPVVKVLASYRTRVFNCCTSKQSNFFLDCQSSTPSTNRDTWVTILEDEYFVGLEPPKDLPSPTVKFYEDPVDRGPDYYVSMTSLNEEIKKIVGIEEVNRGDDPGTPNVIRNDSGFWHYKNRNVYLQEVAGGEH
jgi:hypothetical protein